MTRAALYLRISRDAEATGKGVARQQAECMELIQRKGITLVQTFEDNDISASSYSKKKRPGFEGMLALAEAGEVDTLIAWDLDRLIRRPMDGEALIELNARTGVNILTVFDSVDLTTPNGRLFLRIKTDVAAHESEHKSERIKAAHRQRLAEGKPISGKRPFGWEPGGLVIRESEADAIREGIADFLSGATVLSIQKRWNRAGLYGPTGKPWSVSNVKHVLRRWRNAGLLEHNGHVLDGPSQIPALVTRAEVEAVRDRLAYIPGQVGRPVNLNWLNGVMACGVCGQRMTAKKGFYMCQTQTEGTRALGDATRHVSIKKDLAEDRVRLALYAEANHRARWGDPVEAGGVEKVRAIETALTEALKDRAEATADRYDKTLDQRMVRDRLDTLSADIERLEADRIKYRTATSEAARIATLMVDGPKDSGMDFTREWIAYFDSLTVEEKRDLARTLTVTVSKGGKGAKRVSFDGLAGTLVA